MKAVGNYLLIKKTKEGTKKTQGGLLLSEKDRSDIRYIKAEVVSVGDQVTAIKENDFVFYDKHNAHKVEYKNKTYQVIKLQDIVVVL